MFMKRNLMKITIMNSDSGHISSVFAYTRLIISHWTEVVCTFSRESLGAGERSIARHTQHNVASVTEHLPGACGGHDARKGTYRLRASGTVTSGIEQSVTA